MACAALITSLIPSNPVNSSFHRDLHITETALDPIRLQFVRTNYQLLSALRSDPWA